MNLWAWTRTMERFKGLILLCLFIEPTHAAMGWTTMWMAVSMKIALVAQERRRRVSPDLLRVAE